MQKNISICLSAAQGEWIELISAKRVKRQQAASFMPQCIAALFKLPEEAGLPLAAITALAYGLPEQVNWLRADPVSLQADLAHVYLLGNQQIDLQPQEIELLRELINTHLADLGLRLFTPTATHWYLQLPTTTDIRSVALASCIGRPIDELLPKGNQPLNWLTLFNELQMLLHGSEINQQRAAQGQATVDGLWFWGEGKLPEALPQRFQQVFCDEPIAEGLAKLSQTPYQAASDQLSNLLEQCEQPGSYLISVDDANGSQWVADTEKFLRKERRSCIDFYLGDGYGYRLQSRSKWWHW